MPLSDGTDRASSSATKATSNNAPVPTSDPVGSRGALLAAQARSLDARLRVAALSDRQASRRAAAHVVQLARRISRLLPRVPTLLPVLPESGRDGRVRHYVLQAQPVVGTNGTRILTISTHSVLRFGEFDGTGRPVLWNEYDPLQPVSGWDLEVVLERLGQVLAQIQEQVEQLEARVAARANNLNALLNGSPSSKPTSVSPPSGPLPSRPSAPARVVVSVPKKTAVRVPVPLPVPIPPAAAAVAAAAVVPDVGLDAVLEVLAHATEPALKQSDEVRESSGAAPSESMAEVFDELLPDLALIDLAFAAVGEGTSHAAAEPNTQKDHEKRERRLFQHLRVR